MARRTPVDAPPPPQAAPLFTTNLAWRVEIVRPSAELNQQLIEAARRPDLAPKFVALVHSLRKALPAGDARLETEILYTSWGLAALEALQAEVVTFRGGRR